ncbi:olfactory receptor 51D1 [Marmota marmota marmota]|uniref:olfactory receptor 51D1 n=1 Tax=Marmota marmota marmota TaxID=9994 RepID=UPI00076234EA|nr:olfactory receptor 51D1 [Marmota marmota marmota]
MREALLRVSYEIVTPFCDHKRAASRRERQSLVQLGIPLDSAFKAKRGIPIALSGSPEKLYMRGALGQRDFDVNVPGLDQTEEDAEGIALGPLVPVMAFSNGTLVHPAYFLLVGIPGVGPDVHFWLAFPLCFMYALATLGNLTIILIIRMERHLHQPMYLFLAMLSTIDLVLSSVTMPKMTILFLMGIQEIEFSVCLAQMFLIHALSAMESAVLLAMAFDRFVAICHPLRHASVLTGPTVAKIGLAALTRGFVFFFPLPFILKRLSYCRTHTVTHSFCLHQDIMKLSCTDTTVNVVYGLFIILSVMGVDSFFIGFSYILILRAVLELSSQGAALKAFNTCISHLCAVLVFYVPLIGLSVVHRLGGPTTLLHVVMANIYLLLPPVVNPIVYGAKTKEIRSRVVHMFSQGGR